MIAIRNHIEIKVWDPQNESQAPRPSTMATMATVRPAPWAGPAPVPRRRGGRLLRAAAALAALALAGADLAAAQMDPEDPLAVEASARCRVEFNATGFPEGVAFFIPNPTEAFSNRPIREAETLNRFTEDFAEDFVDQYNMAMTGWRKKKKGGGWKKAYTVVTATGIAFDATTQTLRYGFEQFPGQAGVTKNFGGGGGKKKVTLRFCTMFKDGLHK